MAIRIYAGSKMQAVRKIQKKGAVQGTKVCFSMAFVRLLYRAAIFMTGIERLSYHFEPEKGWINDPNGLCWFKGEYHAFFQHNPHAPKWDTMHWGHAVSKDLLHWQELPIALYPDMPYENGDGCFSGSALEKDGDLYLMYTAVSKELGQTQCIAISHDGRHFEKYAGNPVVAQSPVDPASRDFRDPKIFPYGDGYRMVCGAGTGGLGSVLLYKSADLLHWEYIGPIFQSRDYGPVPECPDLFPLGDKWVLLFSRMDKSRASQFVVGSFDGETFTPESFQIPEKGPDFYAGQTFLDEKGRRILIAWMHSWEREVPAGAVRAGALTIPREISLAEGKVCTYPVEEARHLLRDAAPLLSQEGEEAALVQGEQVMLSLPRSQVREAAFLQDGHAREVFINCGEFSCTFYAKE